ncbi:DUF397 domain-containing protein [Streptomyces sp. NPDC049906]|uniref:DUF397 domain-containing protein n=1 Tax=Streptomyces sp. NPDC049906 TaxID=3155656 RepID=UPI00344300E3
MTSNLATYHWVKSSYSNNGGSCLEWAPAYATLHDIVSVRDSKNANGPVLTFPVAAFTTFVAGLKARHSHTS